MRLFIFSDGKAAHSIHKFLGCLEQTERLRFSQSGSMILWSGDWDDHSRTFTLCWCWLGLMFWIIDMLKCPSSFHAQLPGWWVQIFLQFFFFFFDYILHSSCHQFWPDFLCLFSSHMTKTSAIHLCFNDVNFIICLVDSSPNVTFIVVAKKFNFGLITSNNFVPEGLSLCAVCRIVSKILCAICIVKAFFRWRYNGVPPYCASWNTMFSEGPVFYL